MIEFLTLFVGFVVGIHEVAVAVPAPVARVEIRRDGDLLATIGGPPWRAPCDFGRELHPGRLEAIAFDADGHELDRDLQWLNLPGPWADAAIVAIRSATGEIEAAQLAWSSPEFEEPRRIVAELDGEPLKVRPPYRIDLGDLPEKAVHVLSVAFHFGPDAVLRRELAFGGNFAGSLDSGLTAVVVRLEDLDELPEPPAMEGWFMADGVPLRVAAVEEPDARIVIVRDPTVVNRLAEMMPELQRRHRRSNRGGGRRKADDAFGSDVELRLLSPEPMTQLPRGSTALLFPYSGRPAPGPDGVVAAAVGTAPGSLLGGPLMMADAVAVAGLRAAEGNGRRAVVVLLGAQREDGSRFSPAIARQYLADLHVPLEVWDVSGPVADPPPGWGDLRPVDNVDDLIRAVRRVRVQVEDQRVVWLSGRYLPQEIMLAPAAAGISLAE